VNPRQRRGVLMIGVAALGAVVVFIAILSYVGDVQARVGDMRPVLRLTQDVEAYTPVTPEMVRTVRAPDRWTPEAALSDPGQVLGLVASSTLPKGAMLQNGMLVARPGIRQGYREIAILVDARTGVAGKVRSGDRVDIIATSQFEGRPPRAEIIVEDALVIDVGLPRPGGGQESGGFEEPEETVPVTFALPVEEALRVSFAESFAVEVRLALRGGGDAANVPGERETYLVPGVEATP
jgi:Flp pilus assembly protein CpaB